METAQKRAEEIAADLTQSYEATLSGEAVAFLAETIEHDRAEAEEEIDSLKGQVEDLRVGADAAEKEEQSRSDLENLVHNIFDAAVAAKHGDRFAAAWIVDQIIRAKVGILSEVPSRGLTQIRPADYYEHG